MTAAATRRPRLAFAATMAAAALAGLVAAGGPARASEDAVTGGEAMAQVARIMSREQAALHALGADRIQSIARDRAAATTAVPVAVATRGAAADAPDVAAPAVLDFAALDAMQPVSGDQQWQCLAAAIYFEARGEPLAGQIGVAEVVLNRVELRSFPGTVCGVTTQGAGSGRGCQFSYACDGRSDVMTSAAPKARAEKLARMLIDGRPRTVTDGATHFHATFVRPDWSRKFARTAAIGNHVFYRQGTRVASN